MDLALITFKSDGDKREFRLKGRRLRIGRQRGCDLRVPVPSVSREHCEIAVEDDGRVTVRDLGSRNGTFRNEAKVQGVEDLEPGDRLAVGPVIFTVRINGTPEHIEPPLLESPATGTDVDHGDADGLEDSSPATISASSMKRPTAAAPAATSDPDDSAADISDLINQITGDDSDEFDFGLDWDDEEESKS